MRTFEKQMHCKGKHCTYFDVIDAKCLWFLGVS